MRHIPAAELPDFVDAEMRRVLDARWSIRRVSPVEWSIDPPDDHGPPGEVRYYGVLVAAHCVVVVHGPESRWGGAPGLPYGPASVIPCVADPIYADLRFCDCFLRVLEEQPPVVGGRT